MSHWLTAGWRKTRNDINRSTQPVVPALKHYEPRSDPIPDRFNRHATGHCVEPVHYTPVNAVIGLMLGVSLLREAEESGW
jgi:hypothetical protein